MEQITYTESEVWGLLQSVMNLGMEVRQHQLISKVSDERYDGKSGLEILKEFWEKRKKLE